MHQSSRTRNAFSRNGFSLVELMIVVVVLGVLAAIAIPLYLRFVQRSKTGEAEANLGKIASLAEQFYAKSGNQGTVATITPGAISLTARLPGTARTPGASCAGSPGVNGESVPRVAASVTGRTYQPAINEWACSVPAVGCTQDTAWAQLEFEISSPIRFLYCYASDTPASGSQYFLVVASGNQDGDGTWSRWERRGETLDGALHLGSVNVINDDE